MAKKKKTKCKYGTNPDGSCKKRRTGYTGTRSSMEIRHHKIRKREPYLSDVSGVGIDLTKKLEKRGLITCGDLKSKGVRVEELTAVEGIGEGIANKIFTFCKLKITRKAKPTKTEAEVEAQELGNARYFILAHIQEHNRLFREDTQWNRHPTYQKVLDNLLDEGILIESEFHPKELVFNDNKKNMNKARSQIISKLKKMNYVDYSDLWADIKKDKDVVIYKGRANDLLQELKNEGFVTEEYDTYRRESGGSGYFLHWRGTEGTQLKKVLTNRVKNASTLNTLSELEKEIIQKKGLTKHYSGVLLEDIRKKREKLKTKRAHDYFDNTIKGKKRDVYERFVKEFKVDEKWQDLMMRDFEDVGFIYDPAHIVGLTPEERLISSFEGSDWVEVTPKKTVKKNKLPEFESFGSFNSYYVWKAFKSLGGKTKEVKVYVNKKKWMPLKLEKDKMYIVIAPTIGKEAKDNEEEKKLKQQALKRIKTGIKEGFDYS